MRVATLITTALPLASAGTIAGRSAATVASAIKNINTDVVALNNTLNTFTSSVSLQTLLKLQYEDTNIVTAIKQATAAVDASKSFTDEDSLSLVAPIQTLDTSVSDVVDNLIRHKAAFDAASAEGVNASAGIEQDLETQRSAAQKLNSALAKKTPSTLVNVFNSLTADAITSLNRGIAAFAA